MNFNSEEIIDLEDALKRVQGDEKLLAELFDVYQEDFVIKRQALGVAIAACDIAKIKGIAHSMKGASGHISAKPLHAACLKLESSFTAAMRAASSALIRPTIHLAGQIIAVPIAVRTPTAVPAAVTVSFPGMSIGFPIARLCQQPGVDLTANTSSSPGQTRRFRHSYRLLCPSRRWQPPQPMPIHGGSFDDPDCRRRSTTGKTDPSTVKGASFVECYIPIKNSKAARQA